LNKDKFNLEEKIYDLQIIAIIKDIISNNKIQTMGDLINIYNSKYFQIYQVPDVTIKNICSKYRIQKLLEYNTDITSTQLELNKILVLLSNISNSAFNKFQEIYNQLNR